MECDPTAGCKDGEHEANEATQHVRRAASVKRLLCRAHE
jgi:hypothetical protein